MIDGKKMNNLAQQYEEQGFVLIQGKEDEFSALRSDFLRVFNEISFLNGAGEINNDQQDNHSPSDSIRITPYKAFKRCAAPINKSRH